MSGRNAQIRGGFEVEEGVPGHDFTFIPFASETLKMEYVSKQGANIDPSGNEGEGDILEAHGTGNITSSEINSESLLKVRAHMHGYNETSEVVAGVQLWELRDLDEVNDTPVAYYKDSMHFGIWRDEQNNPTEYSVLGAKAAQMELSVQKGEYASMSHDFLFTRDTRSRKPHEQAVNAAWLGDIHVRGLPTLRDDYYKFKVVTPGALGVATFVWGKGIAGYGATEYLTAVLMDVMNANDTLAGTRSIPYQIIIDPAGVFTANDEFRIYPYALKAVAAFSTRPKLHGAAALVEFTMGTTFTREIQEFSIRHGVPREAKGGIGSIYDQRIGEPADAKHWAEFEFSQNYVDDVFDVALATNVPIAVYSKLYGAKIGATVHEDFAEYELTQAHITNAGATIQSAGDNDENVVLRAFGVSFIERYQNTITSITPT